MLLCAIISSVFCILGYYCFAAIIISGIITAFLFTFMLIKHYNPIAVFVVFMIILTEASVLYNYCEMLEIRKYDGVKTYGEFTVCDTPVDHGTFYTAALKTKEYGGLKGGIKFNAVYYGKELECGDSVTANVKFSLNGEKYIKSYDAERTYISGNISKIKVNENSGNGILKAFGKIREYIKRTLFSYMKNENAATLNAVLTGDKQQLSDEMRNLIKNAGVSHVTVVSGMHLSVIVAAVTFLTGKLFYNRFAKAVSILLTVLFVNLLCGFTPSVMRAGGCYILYAAAVLLKSENCLENTLGGAVSLMLINSPFIIFSVSFQLSVLATLGIVAAALPVINAVKIRIKNKSLIWLISSVTVTLCAAAFTMPVSICIFGYISVVSVITNLLISFAVTAALVVTAAGIIISLISLPIADFIFSAAELLAYYINYVITLFGSMPFATVNTGKASFVVSFFAIILILTVLFACKKRNDMLKLKLIEESFNER